MARNRIIPIFVPHLGCPHQCVFCNQRNIAGTVRPKTASEVTTTIESGLQYAGKGAEVAFYGGSFTAISAKDQEELLGAVQPFLESESVSGIRLSTRPDAINWDVVERLKRYGVKTVELGSQSMDDTVLQCCQRGHRARDTERAVALLKESGISVVLQMMTGLPGSDDTSDFRTGACIAALQPDGVRIYPTVVVEDTQLADRYHTGQYQPQTTEEAVACCAKLYRLFDDAGIPVLRLGLQPTEDLSGGKAIAGPYHPAFGELVKSRILYENACTRLDTTTEKTVTLLVRKDRFSAMIGQKRENIRRLSEKYPDKNLKVAVGDCEAWEILLQSGAKLDKIT